MAVFSCSSYTHWVNPEYSSDFNGIILPLATIEGHSRMRERWEYRQKSSRGGAAVCIERKKESSAVRVTVTAIHKVKCCSIDSQLIETISSWSEEHPVDRNQSTWSTVSSLSWRTQSTLSQNQKVERINAVTRFCDSVCAESIRSWTVNQVLSYQVIVAYCTFMITSLHIVEIDHEIISTTIVPTPDSSKAVVRFWRKNVHMVLI